MGGSLARLLSALDVLDASARDTLARIAPVTLPAPFALAARAFAVPADAAAAAYLWSWLENQVLAALKTIPLGQVAGQRMLLALGGRIPAVLARAAAIADDDIASFASGLALASARHETQYSRLFRS
jgi:urease accessory protein